MLSPIAQIPSQLISRTLSNINSLVPIPPHVLSLTILERHHYLPPDPQCPITYYTSNPNQFPTTHPPRLEGPGTGKYILTHDGAFIFEYTVGTRGEEPESLLFEYELEAPHAVYGGSGRSTEWEQVPPRGMSGRGWVFGGIMPHGFRYEESCARLEYEEAIKQWEQLDSDSQTLPKPDLNGGPRDDRDDQPERVFSAPQTVVYDARPSTSGTDSLPEEAEDETAEQSIEDYWAGFTPPPPPAAKLVPETEDDEEDSYWAQYAALPSPKNDNDNEDDCGGSTPKPDLVDKDAELSPNTDSGEDLKENRHPSKEAIDFLQSLAAFSAPPPPHPPPTSENRTDPNLPRRLVTKISETLKEIWTSYLHSNSHFHDGDEMEPQDIEDRALQYLRLARLAVTTPSVPLQANPLTGIQRESVGDEIVKKEILTMFGIYRVLYDDDSVGEDHAKEGFWRLIEESIRRPLGELGDDYEVV